MRIDQDHGPGWRAELLANFQRQYARRFGTVAPGGEGTEVLTWRVSSRGPRPRARLRVVNGYVSIASARAEYGVEIEYVGDPDALVRPPSSYRIRHADPR